MKIIKRIIALIILVPAIISFLGMLGAIVGTWAFNNTVTQVGVDVLGAGSDFVGGTMQGIAEVETLLIDAQAVVGEIEDEIERVGDDINEGDAVLDGIAQLLDTDLETLIADIDAFFASIQQTALALADVVDALSDLPAVADETEQVDQNIFRNVAADLDALSGEIDTLLNLVQQGTEDLTEQVVTDLTAATNSLTTSIDELLAQLTTINTDLTTLQNDLVDAQTSWAQVIDLFSIGLTIIFLFIALAFLSLTVHAWAFFRQAPPRTATAVSTGASKS